MSLVIKLKLKLRNGTYSKYNPDDPKAVIRALKANAYRIANPPREKELSTRKCLERECGDGWWPHEWY